MVESRHPAFYTQNRFSELPHTAVGYHECVRCENNRKCMTHTDYPGMHICYDCFDELSPPVDYGDHSNHWNHENWDSVAKALGREVVPHGVMQDGRYYPVGTRPPANRPASNHIELIRKEGTAEERRAFVRRVLRNG